MQITPEWILVTLFVPVIIYLFHRLEKSTESFLTFLRDERSISTQALTSHTEASKENNRMLAALLEREESEIALLKSLAEGVSLMNERRIEKP